MDTHGDGLITLPTAESLGQRAGAWVIALVFGLLLVATGVVDSVWPSDEALPVGQEASALLRDDLSHGFLDGGWARRIERSRRLTSRVRYELAPWWTLGLMKYARRGSPDVIVGDGGWMFLRPRVELPLAANAALIEPGVQMLSALDRRFAKMGIQLVVLPIPRKAFVAAEHLPSGIDPRRDFEPLLNAALAEAGVTVVDLVAAWSAMAPEDVYPPGDSHWATGGQIAAARALLERCPDLRGTDFEAEAAVEVLRAGPNDVWCFAGIPQAHPAFEHIDPPPRQLLRVEPPEIEAMLRRRTSDADVALTGTSFSASTFSTIVQVLAGQRFIEASWPGTRLAETAARLFVSTASGTRPGTIVMEFPTHYLSDLYAGHIDALRCVGDCFVAALPCDSTDIAPDPTLGWRPGDGRVRLVNDVRRVVTTRDGVVSLRVRSEAAGGSRWRYASGPLHFEFEWPATSGEVLLPLLGADAAFELTALDAFAEGLALDARLVTDLDLAGAREGIARADAPRTFDFQSAVGSRRGGLVIEFGAAPGEPTAGGSNSTTVIGAFADGTRHTWVRDVGTDATWVLGFGREGRAGLVSVEVLGPHPVRRMRASS